MQIKVASTFQPTSSTLYCYSWFVVVLRSQIQYFLLNVKHPLQFEAVQSLHDQGFVYLDVKAANFLFVKRKIAGEDVVRLALADFGTSAKVERRMDDCIKRGDMLAIFGIVLNLMFDVGSAYAIIGEDEIFRQKVPMLYAACIDILSRLHYKIFTHF